MNKIETSYQITVADYRQASYYGMGLRQYKSLRVLILMAGAAFLSLCTSGVWDRGMELGVFLGAACLIWLFTIFGGAELGIRRYIKQKDTMIGCRYDVTLESHRIRFQVPERNVDISIKTGSLAAVFELNRQFLIYTSLQDAYILPFRALTEEQKEDLRSNFRYHLNQRFHENKRKPRRMP